MASGGSGAFTKFSEAEEETTSVSSKSPRSIMKKEAASAGFNRTISFAEEAEVAEVL